MFDKNVTLRYSDDDLMIKKEKTETVSLHEKITYYTLDCVHSIYSVTQS